MFERYVGSIVRSIDGNERRAWHRFYDNTLAALRAEARLNGGSGTDFIRSFRAIYARVETLVAEIGDATGSVNLLDVATCFGFLPLFLAGRDSGDGSGARRRITGCDLNPALIALADDYRRQRDIDGVTFLHADFLAAEAEADLRALGGTFQVVTAIHFLEHIAPEDTAAAVERLWALTGRRLIIAVPLESEPDRRFGHRQVFDRERLAALGRQTGGSCEIFEHHGGWLVADCR